MKIEDSEHFMAVISPDNFEQAYKKMSKVKRRRFLRLLQELKWVCLLTNCSYQIYEIEETFAVRMMAASNYRFILVIRFFLASVIFRSFNLYRYFKNKFHGE